MRAAQFNERFSIGHAFIFQPVKVLRGGYPVKTVDQAIDVSSTVTVVEIDEPPYFANVQSLTPAR
ncbi:hypothetical protein EYD79_00910 [Shigella sonnei]|nr:hypothetical protein [Escherichia coli]EFW5532196.1 hypothetical protein [Shigella sonnei]EFX7053205.1 hypothetical protein [Shigella sonnei]EGA6848500.1 hypothetical protein [Shigella sonnei]EKC9672209.1 hypothetical protein [Escherichia coli]